MALPKYTDPAVQNKTQDEATDHMDSLHAGPMATGKNVAVETEKINNDKNKIKSYREGIKDETTSDESDDLEEDGVDYSFDEDDDELDDSEFYGKNL